MGDVHSWEPVCRAPRGLVRPVRVDPTGREGPTRGQARGPRWRQTSRGFYVPADVDPDVPEQRILEMSMLLPGCGAVTGWAACRWWGAGYFDGVESDGRTRRRVPLALGPRHDLRDREGAVLLRDRLPGDDVAEVRGLAVTRPERALFDEMRSSRTVRAAVVAMDMMAAAELTSISRMREYCHRHPRWNGVPLVRAALDLADERSMSPNETRMRLIWVLDAGLPPPLVNQPVFDLQGRLIGIADLLDPVAGMVGEYDGAAHRAARRHHRDVVREHRFRAVGLEYVQGVGPDVHDRGPFVDRIHSTRSRALWLPPARRRWTLTPPPGWHTSPLDSMSLDERLSYREWLAGERAG